MEIEQANQLIAIYGNRLPMESIEMVRGRLIGMEYTTVSLKMSQFKDPTLSIILSILVGSLGVDRFYIGDTGMGVGKLLTCGGAYIWWLIDIFMIQDATRRKNLESFLMFCYY